MRLSEAIRLGAMLKPRCCIDVFRERDGELIASCAIGAALDAIGKSRAFRALDSGSWFALASREFPILDTFVTHPVDGETDGLRRTVWRLNDRDGWTREQIADWIEGLEAAQAIDDPSSERCGTTATAEPALSPRG